MTLSEKIAQTPRLERIDSSIESCIKILEQELEKRKIEDPNEEAYYDYFSHSLGMVKRGFNWMKGKK